MASKIGTAGSLVGGVIAAIVASACCVGPLVLATIGVGGTWVAQLTEFEAVRPMFFGLTLGFLGLAFHRLYMTPQVCGSGTMCADPRTLKRQRSVFWIVSALLLALIAFPWAAPLLY